MSKKIIFIIPENLYFSDKGELNINSDRPYIKIWLKRVESANVIRSITRPSPVLRHLAIHEVLRIFNNTIITKCFSNLDLLKYSNEIQHIKVLLLWKYCKSQSKIIGHSLNMTHANISYHAKTCINRATVDKKFKALLDKIYTFYEDIH